MLVAIVKSTNLKTEDGFAVFVSELKKGGKKIIWKPDIKRDIEMGKTIQDQQRRLWSPHQTLESSRDFTKKAKGLGVPVMEECENN